MPISRRAFIHRGAAFSMGFAGLAAVLRENRSLAAALNRGDDMGYGALVPDPQGLLDLPAGFSYTVFSKTGEEMNDGLLVPGKHDGMGAFPGPDGRVVLVRNHELEETWTRWGPFGLFNERFKKVKPTRVFDAGGGGRPGLGGTTTLIYNPKTRVVEHQFMSLLGTSYNCAGGKTPWGSWLTCEETTVGRADGLDKDHGWVFEVPAGAREPVSPDPITAMGRFRHEAVAINPGCGCAYLTEDLANGVLYRYLPKAPGRLIEGGRLQALVVNDQAMADLKNWEEKGKVAVGARLAVSWVDLDDVLSPKDDLRVQAASKKAALFARCEGIWWGNDGAYIAATSGGIKQLGQIWRYVPSAAEGTPEEAKSPAKLELVIEPDNSSVLNNADNITVSPWGDLIVCEDGSGHNGLVGVTPDGRAYRLAMIRAHESETAGACFSPDGSILFVNAQSHPGATFAITGPWKKS